jgi:hypothetical protein
MKSFRSPNEAKIPGRTSSITGVFVNSIVPNIKPNSKELKEVYRILKLDDDNLKCAYCGVNDATEWDHFRPTVNDKKPTGYLADIYNLVPACGKCNQSKGGKNWRDWIQSEAKLSPKKREIRGLKQIIQRLERYDKWSSKKVNKVDFDNLDETTQRLLKQHWRNCEEIINKMHQSQRLADRIKKRIIEHNGWP